MTKREICERLMRIHNSVMFASNGSGDIGGNPCYGVGNAIRELLLDLAASDEHFADAGKMMSEKEGHFADLGKKGATLPYGTSINLCGQMKTTREELKAEEKHPGVIAKPGKDGEIEFCWCQKCYEQAAVVHDPFGDGENWSYCPKCGVSFRLKRKEEADK